MLSGMAMVKTHTQTCRNELSPCWLMGLKFVIPRCLNRGMKFRKPVAFVI